MNHLSNCIHSLRKHRFLIVSIIAVLFAAGFFVIFFHEGYPKRISDHFSTKPKTGSVETNNDKTIDAWNNCLVQLGVKSDIVFFGDSITRRGNFSSYFPDKTICNLGIGSDTILGMIARVDMLSTVSPSDVFIMGGINSLRDDNLNESVKEFHTLLDKIASSVDANVYVISVLPISQDKASSIGCSPATIRQFNQEIQLLTKERGFTYIDLHSALVSQDGFINQSMTTDGVHITDDAYQLWVDAVRTYIP